MHARVTITVSGNHVDTRIVSDVVGRLFPDHYATEGWNKHSDSPVNAPLPDGWQLPAVQATIYTHYAPLLESRVTMAAKALREEFKHARIVTHIEATHAPSVYEG